ncbi:MAG: hypothetical protein OEZ02_09360 [Anaerolineae bacterium]|nr:hypothetical protein [Anaerolineae bacterium]
MIDSRHITLHKELLEIRATGIRPKLIVVGGFLFLAFVASLARAYTNEFSSPIAYILALIIILLGGRCLAYWVKLEIIKSSVETLDALQKAFNESLALE